MSGKERGHFSSPQEVFPFLCIFFAFQYLPDFFILVYYRLIKISFLPPDLINRQALLVLYHLTSDYIKARAMIGTGIFPSIFPEPEKDLVGTATTDSIIPVQI